jgi:hypothetical protein
MFTSKRTILAFDERQLDYWNQIKESLAKSSGSIILNKEIFLIAMGVGYYSKNRIEDFKRSNTGVRMEYIKDEDEVLFAALQISETDDEKSLLDVEGLLNLAESYAAGGIAILWRHFQQERDFAEWFAAFVHGPLMASQLD